MDIKDEIKQINEKILNVSEELKKLKEKKNDLLIKLFYEAKGLEYGQRFMYKGKEIVKIKVYNSFYLNGYYITKKGEVSEKPISIYIGDEIDIKFML